MSIVKSQSQLADKNSNPMIGNRQPAITDVPEVGGAYDAAEVNVIVARVNEVLASLREHGLISS